MTAVVSTPLAVPRYSALAIYRGMSHESLTAHRSAPLTGSQPPEH